jgi:hypothetical protein
MRKNLKRAYKSLQVMKDAHEAYKVAAGLHANEMSDVISFLSDGGHLQGSQANGYLGLATKMASKLARRTKKLAKSHGAAMDAMTKMFDFTATQAGQDPEQLRSEALAEHRAISGTQSGGGRHAGMQLDTNQPGEVTYDDQSVTEQAIRTGQTNMKGLSAFELKKIEDDMNNQMRKTQKSKTITRVPAFAKSPFRAKREF